MNIADCEEGVGENQENFLTDSESCGGTGL